MGLCPIIFDWNHFVIQAREAKQNITLFSKVSALRACAHWCKNFGKPPLQNLSALDLDNRTLETIAGQLACVTLDGNLALLWISLVGTLNN